jgi:hypothetical protein
MGLISDITQRDRLDQPVMTVWIDSPSGKVKMLCPENEGSSIRGPTQVSMQGELSDRLASSGVGRGKILKLGASGFLNQDADVNAQGSAHEACFLSSESDHDERVSCQRPRRTIMPVRKTSVGAEGRAGAPGRSTTG